MDLQIRAKYRRRVWLFPPETQGYGSARYCYRLPDFLMATTDPEGPAWDPDAAGWKKALLGYCDELAAESARAYGSCGAGAAQKIRAVPVLIHHSNL